MTTTVGSDGILFNNGTLQTTAAVTTTIPTTLYAVGTYVIGRPFNLTSYGVNSTLAGSSLYATNATNAVSKDSETGALIFNSAGNTLVNTGSWRCVSPAFSLSTSSGPGLVGLWLRYA